MLSGCNGAPYNPKDRGAGVYVLFATKTVPITGSRTQCMACRLETSIYLPHLRVSLRSSVETLRHMTEIKLVSYRRRSGAAPLSIAKKLGRIQCTQCTRVTCYGMDGPGLVI